MKRLPAGTSIVMACLALMPLTLGCDKINNRKHSQHDKADGLAKAQQEYLRELMPLIGSSDYYKVKSIEVRDGDGKLVERDSYEYTGETRTRELYEHFNSDGALTSRWIQESGPSVCDDEFDKSESIPASTYSYETKTTNTCVDGRVVEARKVKIDRDGNKADTSVTTYDGFGDEIKSVENIDGNKPKTTEHQYIRDGRNQVLEELKIVDGKSAVRYVYDYDEGTKVAWGPADADSAPLTQELFYSRDLEDGLAPLIDIYAIGWTGDPAGHFAETRNQDGENGQSGKCIKTGSFAITCTYQTIAKANQSVVSTTTITSKAQIVAVSRVPNILAFLGDQAKKYVTDDKMVVRYLDTKSVADEVDANGQHTVSTTTNSFNGSDNLVHSETKIKLPDGSEQVSTEDWTYDMDGARPLTQVSVDKYGKKSSRKFNY